MSLEIFLSFLVGLLLGAGLGALGAYLWVFKQSRGGLTELQSQMSEKFENLAHKVLADRSNEFLDQNLRSIQSVLAPVKEQLIQFEKKVHDSYSSEREERGVLKGELSKLFELNQRVSQEAMSLRQALKGDNRAQGAWGEMILESVLEKSGLRRDDEYILQGEGLALKSESGAHQKPDVLVVLPEGKFIVIDSKVSLGAYDQYLNSSGDEQIRFGNEHADSLRRHVDQLADKQYHNNEKLDSPHFTLLFMPLEPAFALAVRVKPELLQYAWQKNIALVSPTTLLTTLRTVSALWRQDRQNKNAKEIAKSSGALYEKFYSFLLDLEDVGKRMKQAHESYDNALSKLTSGKGNLIRQVEKLKDLGAKTDKNLEDIEARLQ